MLSNSHLLPHCKERGLGTVEAAPRGMCSLKVPYCFSHGNNPFVNWEEEQRSKSLLFNYPPRCDKGRQSVTAAGGGFQPVCYQRCLQSGPRVAQPAAPLAWRRGWRHNNGGMAPLCASGHSSSSQGAPPRIFKRDDIKDHFLINRSLCPAHLS